LVSPTSKRSSLVSTLSFKLRVKIAGFDSVISTSHYMEDYFKVEVLERKKIYEELKSLIESQNINLKIFMGNEIFITENIINLLKNNKICTQNNTNYVLFELPFNIKPINIIDAIYEMQQHKLIPILAHPERYAYFYDEWLVFIIFNRLLFEYIRKM